MMEPGTTRLGRVQDIGVDRIKLDKVIVTNRSAAGLIADIICMARAKGLKITAKGVETAEQKEYSARCGFARTWTPTQAGSGCGPPAPTSSRCSAAARG